jgi:hypothetical protein
MTLTAGSGEEIPAGRRLCTTRRGEILEVASIPGVVAKRYRPEVCDQDPALPRRLRAMISRFNPQWREPDSHVNLAWPVETVLDDERFAGFLMPSVGGTDTLEFPLIASPPERRLLSERSSWSQAFTWRYLVATAANLANVTHLLHEAGVVIGTFSEDDIRISSDARVAILGCDSMQIADRVSGEIFPALPRAGSAEIPLYPSDDLPALSAHIYRLLLDGRDPAGFRGAFDDPDAPDILPGTVKAMFRRASDGNCPTAAEWHELLVHLGDSIATCGQERMHEYWAGFEKCPMCTLAATKLKRHATATTETSIWPGARACPVDGKAVVRAQIGLGSAQPLQVTDRELESVPCLRNALAAGRTHEFCMLLITPTFHDDDERFVFREASVTVSLEVSGNQRSGTAQPLVWWMDPDRDYSSVHLTRSAQFAPVIGRASLTLGTSTDYERDDDHIRAYGLKCREAYWKLTRTLGREITGSYQLLMVVQLPRKYKAEATIEVTATVERRRPRLRRGRGDIGGPMLRISLEPDGIWQKDIDFEVPER